MLEIRLIKSDKNYIMSKKITANDIKEKTKILKDLKDDYNETVSAVNNELGKLERQISGPKVRISLHVAQQCLDTIKNHPENINTIIDLLQQCQDENISDISSSFSDIADDIQFPNDSIAENHDNIEEEDSDSFKADDLELDKFYNQWDANN